MVTVLGHGCGLKAAFFFYLLGSKDNSVAMMAMILTEDYRFLHSEQSQVPLELF